MFFKNSKKYSKTTVMWKLLDFFSDIAAPVRPMELRKHFHRLTHICSIRSQWYFFHNIFSYIRIIHRNPWNSCFQCRHKTFVLGLFSISIQRSRFGLSSYPSIFKTQQNHGRSKLRDCKSQFPVGAKGSGRMTLLLPNYSTDVISLCIFCNSFSILSHQEKRNALFSRMMETKSLLKEIWLTLIGNVRFDRSYSFRYRTTQISLMDKTYVVNHKNEHSSTEIQQSMYISESPVKLHFLYLRLCVIIQRNWQTMLCNAAESFLIMNGYAL